MRLTRVTFLRTALSVVMAAVALCSGAQVIVNERSEKVDPDSIREEFDKTPSFGLYKDNYFIFGPPLGKKATKENTNARIQVSIRQRLTKSTLPWNTYLYLFYTQQMQWNILEKSLPMTDIVFNPGLGLAKPIFKHNKYIGKATFGIEHESNGRDSIQSRSWNRIFLAGDIMLTRNLLIHGKIWIPIVDGENNRDILYYDGIFTVGFQFLSNNRRWRGAIILDKRKTWRMSFNTIIEGSWQFSRRADWCLFAQYYNGYGEDLLNYKEYTSSIRFGIVFRPKYFSDY